MAGRGTDIVLGGKLEGETTDKEKADWQVPDIFAFANICQINGFRIGFSKYLIRFTCIGVYRMSTNNQIIQAIAIDIAC
jgi:preprotein translocase subunit SecA